MNEARKKRIETLKSFLAEDPNDHFSKYALSLEFVHEQREDEAISLFNELITDNPEFLATYYQLGKAYELKKQIENAVHAYTSGIEIARKQRNQHAENELKGALMALVESDDY
jgi:tetratricopeptide (TPR) repeat protein